MARDRDDRDRDVVEVDEKPVTRKTRVKDDHLYDRDVLRNKYGGFHWGAAFFGWLVAIGLGTILMAFLTAAGTATALTALKDDININTSNPGSSSVDVSSLADSAQTIGIVGGILVLLALLISYFAGGYVAGRLSRFDGGRQGLGVWLFSILAMIVLAVLGALFGNEFNLLGSLNLPRIPVDEGDLTNGGLITLLLGLLLTALAAVAGGKAGQRYHDRIDNTVVR